MHDGELQRQQRVDEKPMGRAHRPANTLLPYRYQNNPQTVTAKHACVARPKAIPAHAAQRGAENLLLRIHASTLGLLVLSGVRLLGDEASILHRALR